MGKNSHVVEFNARPSSLRDLSWWLWTSIVALLSFRLSNPTPCWKYLVSNKIGWFGFRKSNLKRWNGSGSICGLSDSGSGALYKRWWVLPTVNSPFLVWYGKHKTSTVSSRQDPCNSALVFKIYSKMTPKNTKWSLCEYVIVHTILGGSPVILWISLGRKSKWLPLEFEYHVVMRTCPTVFLDLDMSHWT